LAANQICPLSGYVSRTTDGEGTAAKVRNVRVITLTILGMGARNTATSTVTVEPTGQTASPSPFNSTRKASNVSVQVTGTVWLNGQGRPMATLVMPDGTKAILAIPHRSVSRDAGSSQAYKVIMAALEGDSTKKG
jgi:hypothetical protein